MPGRGRLVVCTAALVLAGALAPSADAGPVPVAVDAATPSVSPSYYWRWSDGSQARHRTFRQSQYGVPERLPALVVSAWPATGGRAVTLEVRMDGRWRTEDAGRTDGHGQVRLALTPYCPDGRWCDATFDYRAVVGGRTASLRVTFAP